MRARRLLACSVLLALAPFGVHAGEPDSLLETKHLRVSGRVPQAWLDKAGELGEALYPVLREHWAREPAPQRLPLELILHPDRASFQSALRAEGVTIDLTGAGGYTTGDTYRSHVFLQSVAFETRRLILHEITHQFDDRSSLRMRGKVPPWYREGIAEYFGWHRQGPKSITFGRFDVIARNHRPSLMASRAAEPAFDAWKIAAGETAGDYTTALGIVSALLQTKDADVRSLFRTWERKHVHRAGMQGAFVRLFESHVDGFNDLVRAHWKSFAYPWRLPKPGFDVLGETIVANAQDFARLESNSDTHLWELCADVEVEGGARAGLFMQDADGMYVLVEVGSDEVRMYESGSLSGKALLTRQRWSRTAKGTVTVRIAAGEKGVVGIFGGEGRSRGIEPSDHSAHMGLFVRFGEARFTNVRRMKLASRMKFRRPR